MKLEFSQQIFEKQSSIELHENPLIESRVIPCGRTDTHDETNIRFFAGLQKRLKRIGR